MLLYILNYLKKEKITDSRLFMEAYKYHCGRADFHIEDLMQFRLHGVVPDYVRDYVHYLQDNDPWFRQQFANWCQPNIFTEDKDEK